MTKNISKYRLFRFYFYVSYNKF